MVRTECPKYVRRLNECARYFSGKDRINKYKTCGIHNSSHSIKYFKVINLNPFFWKFAFEKKSVLDSIDG